MRTFIIEADEYLKEYAENVPSKGMHMSYMINVFEVVEKYRRYGDFR